MSSGVELEPVREISNATEAFDWLYLQREDLDEETSLYLLRLTMKGRDWICWQVTESWW